MSLDLASARIRLGQQLGGDEGSALIAAGEEWMAAEGIVNPGRMIELVAPGFDSVG